LILKPGVSDGLRRELYHNVSPPNQKPNKQGEMDLIALTVAFALLNSGKITYYLVSHGLIDSTTVSVPWDAEFFASKVKDRRVKYDDDNDDVALIPSEMDPDLKKLFHNPEIGLLSEPATIVDSKKRIVAWLLPGILREVNVLSCFFLYNKTCILNFVLANRMILWKQQKTWNLHSRKR
jgi:hypothetical protein